MSNRNGVDSGGREDGEELGGVGEGETVLLIYCIKKSIFTKTVLRKRINAL